MRSPLNRSALFITMLPAATAAQTFPPVIYRNCNLTTGASTLSGVAAPAGAQWSEVAGYEWDPYGANTAAGFPATGASRLADDFTVGPGGTDLAYVKIAAYTTGASTPTVTAATLRIWDRPPADPAAHIVFGDAATNRLALAEFAPIYRCFNTIVSPTCTGLTAPTTTRHIQMVYIAVNHHLDSGVYWLDWSLTGGNFCPSATHPSASRARCDPWNANAYQFSAGWVPLLDNGQGCVPIPTRQDLYFELLGSGAPGCYANCDSSTQVPLLNVQDFACFLNRFSAGDLYANCDGSYEPPLLNILDFNCFVNRVAAGCP